MFFLHLLHTYFVGENVKFVVILMVLVSGLFAFQEKALNFQGVLFDASGSIVPDSTYTLEFGIYDAEIAGTKIWSEIQLASTLNGVYQVTLGTVSTLGSLAFDKPYYVQIIVNSTVLPTRTKLITVPFAIQSNKADSALFAQIAGSAISAGVASKSVYADTAIYASVAASAATAGTAATAASAVTALKSDTAQYAYTALRTVSGVSDTAKVAQSLMPGLAVKSINGLTDIITLVASDGTLNITQTGNQIKIGSELFSHGVKVKGPCDSSTRSGLHSFLAWDFCIDPSNNDLYLLTNIDFVQLGQVVNSKERNDAWDAASVLSQKNDSTIQVHNAKIIVNELAIVDSASQIHVSLDASEVLVKKVINDTAAQIRVTMTELEVVLGAKVSSPWVKEEGGKLPGVTLSNSVDSLFGIHLIGRSKDGVGRRWSIWNDPNYYDTVGSFHISQYTDNDNDGGFCGTGDEICLTRFSILDNGYVGIGTVTPSEKLDVNGAIKGATLKIGNTGKTENSTYLNRIDLGHAGSIMSHSVSYPTLYLSDNSYYSDAPHFWKRKQDGYASLISLNGDVGLIDFSISDHGTKDEDLSGDFTHVMRMFKSGNVSIGDTNDIYKLDVNGVINVESIAQNSVTELPYAGSWLAYTGTPDIYEIPNYYKDKEGRVHLSGLLGHSGADEGSVICTLPVEFRPVKQNIYWQAAGIGVSSALNKSARIDVKQNGEVVLWGLPTGEKAYWVSLSGISFRAQ